MSEQVDGRKLMLGTSCRRERVKDIQYIFEGICSLGPSSLQVPFLLILHKFRFFNFVSGFGVFVFLSGIQFLGTRWDSTRSSWVDCMPGIVGTCGINWVSVLGCDPLPCVSEI